jgi:hypothetical protein
MSGLALAPAPRLWTWTSVNPNITDYTWFIGNIVGVPANDMPDASVIQWSYDNALNLAYDGLQTVPSQPSSPTVYTWAVYNLGAALLADYAPDTPPSTFWTDLRSKLGLSSWTGGVVSNASDQGTSGGLTMPAFVQNLSPFDLQLMKTPWGRTYMMLAGSWGAIWDIS